MANSPKEIFPKSPLIYVDKKCSACGIRHLWIDHYKAIDGIVWFHCNCESTICKKMSNEKIDI